MGFSTFGEGGGLQRTSWTKALGGLVKRTSWTKNPSEGLVKRTSWTKTVVRCCLKGFGGGRYPTAAPLHQNLADTPVIPTARILTGEPPVNRKSNPLGNVAFIFLAFDVQGCDETFAALSCDHGVDANFNS